MYKDAVHCGTTLQSELENILCWKQWSSSGLSTIGDLFEDDLFLSYSNLVE